MSGTFPSSPAPSAIEISSLYPTLVSTSHSMKRQRRTRGAQRWMLHLSFPPMDRDEWAPIFAFCLKQRGQLEAFQYVLPSPLITPQGTVLGSPVVNNNQGSPTMTQEGTRALWTSGWTALQASALKAGDFLLPAGGGGKVYMATGDVETDSGGFASVPMEPALIDAIAHGQAITVTSVPFTVTLAEDSLRAALTLNPDFGLDLDLIETV